MEGETDKPLKDVRVTAMKPDAWGSGYLKPAYSDAAGRFTFRGFSPGRYELSVSTPDWILPKPPTVTVGLVGVKTDLTLRVQPRNSPEVRTTVQGRVTRAPDDRPCPQGEGWLTGPGDQRNSKIAAIEEGGRIVFRHVRPGTYRADIRCGDHRLPHDKNRLQVPAEGLEGVRFRLERGLSLRGRVVDDQGRPLAGTGVFLMKVSHAGQRRPRGHRTQTGADGAFHFTALDPGLYRISAHRRSYARTPGRNRTHVEIPPRDPPPPVTLVLTPTGTLRGVLRTPVGRVGHFVKVRLFFEERGLLRKLSDLAVQADGRFLRNGLRPGRYRLQPGTACLAPAPGKPHDVEIQAGQTTDVELVVDMTPETITGRVEDPRGRPVPDVLIKTRLETETDAARDESELTIRWEGHPQAITHADGSFSVPSLAPCRYAVGAWIPDLGIASARRVPSGGHVVLTLEAPGALGGVAVGPEGRPVDDFRVVIKDDAGAVRQERFRETQGRWRFTGLGAGGYLLHFSASQGSAQGRWTVEAGTTQDNLRVVLTASGMVEGRVIDATTGRGLAGATVHGHPAERNDLTQNTVTGPDGRYTLQLPPGRAAVGIPSRGHGLLSHVGGCEPPVTVVTGRTVEAPPALMLPRPEGPLPPGTWGMELDEPPVQLTKVWPDGAARRAGLEVGDRIVAANGWNLSGARSCLIWALLQLSTELDLTLEDGRRLRVARPTP